MRNKLRIAIVAIATAVPLALAGIASAQQPAPTQPAPPPQPPQFPNMTFFITGSGGPKGADYGGIAGADAHCQALAARAGAGGKTWRAYLSVQAVGGATAIDARDRIGKGPWANAEGTVIAAGVEQLHDAYANRINTETGLAENGKRIPSRLFVVNQHDILTGSTVDGRAPPADKDMTCRNWTSSTDGSAMLGHHDRMGLRDDAASRSWNASHPSRGCNPDALKSTGGAGLLYCFAAN